MIDRRSLRFRLVVGAAIWILVALVVSGLLLGRLFREHVEAQVDALLVDRLNQVAAGLEIGPDGALTLADRPGDPRFERPYGGLYWQVEPADGPWLRSRSLWDQTLPLEPDQPEPGAIHRHAATLPGLGAVEIVERLVRLPAAPDSPVRVALAAGREDAYRIAGRFDGLLALSLAVLAFGLVLAVAGQVGVGLRPLDALRRQLALIRAGRASRLDGRFASEIQPLTDELNALLAENQAMLERARRQAADLAHGLKTPLTVIGQEAERLQAPALQAQVDRMRAHVDHQLARARAAGPRGRGVGCDVAPAVEGVLQVLRPLAERRGLRVETAVAAPCRFRGARQDLEELLGNLLENATKWAVSRIRLEAAVQGERLVVTVDDDGPGLAPSEREAVFARGRRLDEAVPGSGLGLAIVRDLAELYEGSVRLEGAPLGGLRARLELPAG